ncbi:hypothetical protein FRUB_05100 [Fimbriiglobus ruber]|uniref:Uncharacterized protein n=2 Tax=Fimbriiglobus ruber TaxID=1908690 RepID=A0A225DF50_9BACT|nr:hypothetical protein FRUB_05100 [Fimbriiglobus ruber]
MNQGSIASIVVAGDCLRPRSDGSLGIYNDQIKWLHRLIGRQVYLACGLKPRVLLLDCDTGIDAARFYLRHDLADRVAGWTKIYEGTHLFQELVDAYEPFVRKSLVVGFELPLYLQKILEHLGVPYLDLWIHPVRFLSDLIFGLRASDGSMNETVGRYAISEDDVWMTAGLRRAGAACGPRCQLEPNTTLVLGQERFDKSQIRDGGFIDARSYTAEVSRMVDSSRGPWLIKPHPVTDDHGLMTLVRELVPGARTIRDNVYYLLSQDEITRAVAINSSSAIEARYFDKESILLAPPVIDATFRGDRPRERGYWSVDHRILEVDFWRNVLSALLPTTPLDGHTHTPRPNQFRISLRAFWGFQQIDTDIYVNLAQTRNFESNRVATIQTVGQSANILPNLSLLFPDEAIRENQRVLIRRREVVRTELYGPYLNLSAGHYQLAIHYSVISPIVGHYVPFSVDICYETGKAHLVHLKGCVEPMVRDRGEFQFEIEFHLDREIDGVETRIWSGDSDVMFHRVVLAYVR